MNAAEARGGTLAAARQGAAPQSIFRRFSHRTATAVGSPWAFIAACALILVWGLSGPLFGFSNTWQLVINTGTTIITFLMVFLIQNTQNRDARAMHLKLDELLRAVGEADNHLIDIEESDDAEVRRLELTYQAMGSRPPGG